jgi:hypothetical protein
LGTLGSFKKGNIPWNKGTKGKQSSPSLDHIDYLKKINSERMKLNNPMKNKNSLLKMVQTNIERGNYSKMGKMASERMKLDNPMFKNEIIKKHPLFQKNGYVSKGEEQIAFILLKMNIEFKRQYKIRKYPSKQSYFLDFYLPQFNIAIEFDGD